MTSANDGIIKLDSEFGREIGFTSDLFFGYLWRAGDRVYISFVASKQEGKGNLSRLFAAIEERGLRVVVPTPFPKMVAILESKGFKKYAEKDQLFGWVEVWMRPSEEDDLMDIIEQCAAIAAGAQTWVEGNSRLAQADMRRRIVGAIRAAGERAGDGRIQAMYEQRARIASAIPLLDDRDSYRAQVAIRQAIAEAVGCRERSAPFKYYYALRPPGIGCQPDGYGEINDFYGRHKVNIDGRSMLAHGWVTYDLPLISYDAWRFDLTPEDLVERAWITILREAKWDQEEAGKLSGGYVDMPQDELILCAATNPVAQATLYIRQWALAMAGGSSINE